MIKISDLKKGCKVWVSGSVLSNDLNVADRYLETVKAVFTDRNNTLMSVEFSSGRTTRQLPKEYRFDRYFPDESYIPETTQIESRSSGVSDRGVSIW